MASIVQSDPIKPEPVRSANQALLAQPLLPLIAAQAGEADRTRNISDSVIQAIKASDLMRMVASPELGGPNRSVAEIANELSAVAAACGSTGWCLWNHLLVFHLYASALGPQHSELLRSIARNGEWCSYAAGAGTTVTGRAEADQMILNGRAAFASSARYADWAGVPFKLDTDPEHVTMKYTNFTVVRIDTPGVMVDPTWKSMSLRASATDDIFYKEVPVPLASCTRMVFKFREVYRQPDHAMIHARYREDFVGVSSLWLAAMAIGIAQAALDETSLGIRERIAIMGVKMAYRPTVQVNLGQAAAMISTARASIQQCCRDTDRRVKTHTAATEADYLEQITRPMMALHLCDEAMRLLLRVLGGNGLRESASFERRYRDMQAIPLHMNVHPDRVSEQSGRHLVGLPTNNFY
jgi:alkylation response protein AidB-like acyl-CoA dehydrogenase